MEERIIELEKRVTYLEKYIDELNSVVVEQSKELDKIHRHAAQLESKIAEGASPLQEYRPFLEKPPHY